MKNMIKKAYVALNRLSRTLAFKSPCPGGQKEVKYMFLDLGWGYPFYEVARCLAELLPAVI